MNDEPPRGKPTALDLLLIASLLALSLSVVAGMGWIAWHVIDMLNASDTIAGICGAVILVLLIALAVSDTK